MYMGHQPFDELNDKDVLVVSHLYSAVLLDVLEQSGSEQPGSEQSEKKVFFSVTDAPNQPKHFTVNDDHLEFFINTWCYHI